MGNFLRPDGSFVPSVESGKAERQAAKPSEPKNDRNVSIQPLFTHDS